MYGRQWGMRIVLSVCTMAVVPLTLLVCAGCGEAPAPKWSTVTSGVLPSRPGVTDLGTFALAGDVRLSWTLSGPDSARATFRLQVARITQDGGTWASSSSVNSWSPEFSRRDDSALLVGGLQPAQYRVTVRQRLNGGDSTAYGGSYTLYASVQ